MVKNSDIWHKKGSPSEDVRSNAIIHTTNVLRNLTESHSAANELQFGENVNESGKVGYPNVRVVRKILLL